MIRTVPSPDTITFDTVDAFCSQKANALSDLLATINSLLIKGRDEQGVPIYLTKARIKTRESVFLKTKRRQITDLAQITDLLGVRALCLFEQDIFPVHDFLLSLSYPAPGRLDEISNGDHVLFRPRAINIYSWGDQEARRIIQSTTSYLYGVSELYNWSPGKDGDDGEITFKVSGRDVITMAISRSSKTSGYKSIHYLCEANECNVEIQLRTLLQDVWAELEHNIVYKQGNIHPDISKSFRLLAKQLEHNDDFLSHLRAVRDKERCGEVFSIQNAGPHRYFDYEPRFIQDAFPTALEKNSHEEYRAHVKTRGTVEPEQWVRSARTLLEHIRNGHTQDECSEELRYWLDIETAYVDFCGRAYDRALSTYERLAHRPERLNVYVVFFRMGELHFIRGDTFQSLICFDRCEAILRQSKDASYRNHHIAKAKLAEVYWSLGPEYLHVAIKKIKEAEASFKEYASSAAEKDQPLIEQRHRSLTNNLCWYYVEDFVLSRKTKHELQAFASATNKYRELEKYLEEEDGAPSNHYDTAAWYCYQAFRYYLEKWRKDRRDPDKEKALSYLGDAEKNCNKMWRAKNNHAISTLRSVALQRNHTNEILAAREEFGMEAKAPDSGMGLT